MHGQSKFLSLALLAFSTSSLYAAPIVFTDRTTWAGASAVSTTTFEGLAPASGTIAYPAGYTDGLGINYRGTYEVNSVVAEDSYVIDQAAAGFNLDSHPSSFFWGGFTDGSVFTNGLLTITFPAAITAFGTDFFVYTNPAGGTVNVTLNTSTGTYSDSFATPPAVGGYLQFRGYQFDPGETVNSVTFSISGLSANTLAAPLIDDFSVVSQVPEPGTFALLSAALTGLVVMRRRRA